MTRAAFALVLLGCAAPTPTPVERALAERASALSEDRAVPEGLVLTCEPKESEVSLDGVLQGSCEDLRGRMIALGDGLHRLEIQRPGFATYRAEIALGKTRTALDVALSPSR